MGQHKLTAAELVAALPQAGVVEVVADWPVEGVRLADEKIRVGGRFNQRFTPRAVARIGDDLICASHTQRIGRGAAGVRDSVGGYPHGSEVRLGPLAEFDPLQLEAPTGFR